MQHYCKLLSKLSLFVLFALIIYSCAKDDDINTTSNPTIVNTGTEASANEVARLTEVLSSEKTTTNLSITVVNENNTPISGATVIVNNNNSVTNNDGFILIENVEVYEEYQTIKVSSTGYSDAIKTITPSTNGVTNVAITLMEPTFTDSFNANNGGTVSNNNVAIEFPTNAITNQNGNVYEGDVTVTATYYDPNAATFNATIPGTLVGLDDDNNMQALISKGMLKVDLTDTSGNELELLEGKEAAITLPANENNPETIDLWHLNEEKGIWVQTGTATKIGNKYIATVTHFSTYNLDVKVPAIDIDFVIKDTEGNAIANEEAEITATLDGETYSRKITTDNNGDFTIINAPQNADYNISFTKCGESSVVSAGVISESATKEITVDALNSARFIQFEGILYDCENEVLANKAFIIEIENNGGTDRITSYANADGVYSTTSWLCNYDTTTTYQAQIRLFDGDNDILTDTELTFDSDNIFKNIIVCNGTIEPVAERVYEGDLTINSDQKLEEFALNGYTRVKGNLIIEHLTTTNLKGLETLRIIDEKLIIQNNENLINLIGLENLTSLLGNGEVYGNFTFSLKILNNSNLITLDGFNKLTNVSIWIENNNNLLSLKGIENIAITNKYYLFNLLIWENNLLKDISALYNFTKFSTLNFTKNPKLENLSGLESTTSIDNLAIQDSNITNLDELSNLKDLYSLNLYNNDLLNDLSGLSNINPTLFELYFYGNDLLTDLNDLSNIQEIVFKLTISNNKSLSNFCGLSKSMISDIGIKDLDFDYSQIEISENAYNPTKQDLLDGNCSE